jgi:hypothetical protein
MQRMCLVQRHAANFAALVLENHHSLALWMMKVGPL